MLKNEFIQAVIDRNKSDYKRIKGVDMPQKEIDLLRKQAQATSKILFKEDKNNEQK